MTTGTKAHTITQKIRHGLCLYVYMISLSLIALLYYLVRELRRANARHRKLVRALVERRIITTREMQSEEDSQHEVFPWPA